ncbi:MAG TPA: DUF6600 domain-containing protein, partial [Chitinophagaceae bacterium]|nr:DUF6600 domain-containing protein [Chitinophagaceae bacterium]
ISLLWLGAAITLMGCTTTRSMAGMDPQDYAEQPEGPGVSFNVFYQSLSPYGSWISYPQYGQVWIPNAGRGFEPYSTNGHWVYSEYGWTWVSDYSWGWAPFHYGRWLFDNQYGWVWVPGEQWAPAWVAWRNSPQYYGWAPLGPGININVNFNIPANRWVFVPRHYFGGNRAHYYYVPRARNTTIINNTTIIRNVNVYQNNRFYAGPTRRDVQSATRRTVRPVRVSDATRPGETRVTGRQLSMYRPGVTRTSSGSNRSSVAPSRETPATSRPAVRSSEQNNRNASGQRPAENNRSTVRPEPQHRVSPSDTRTPVQRVSPQNDRKVTPPPASRAPASRQMAPEQRPVQRPAQKAPVRSRPQSNSRASVQRPSARVQQSNSRTVRPAPRASSVQHDNNARASSSRRSSPRGR